MKKGIAGSLASQFINSKLTPLLMIVFVAVGIYSGLMTPKEEEPQIDVPIADIFLQYPGAISLQVSIGREKVDNIHKIQQVELVTK